MYVEMSHVEMSLTVSERLAKESYITTDTNYILTDVIRTNQMP